MAGGKRQQSFKKRPEGEGRSTTELFMELRRGSLEMERLMEFRRDRDRASKLLTEIYLAVTQIAERFAAVGNQFESRPPRMDDEEDEHQDQEPIGMAELFPDEPTQHESEMATALLAVLPDDMRQRVDEYRAAYRSIELVRAEHYRSFIDFTAKGARQVSEVAANLLALSRRVRPESMKALGMGQVEVARKLGEKRATTSAREKRKVVKPLKGNGTKGYLLHGTHKTESHAAKCSKSAMNNTNRKDAHAKKQAALAELARKKAK